MTYARKAFLVYHGFKDLKSIFLISFVAWFAYFWVFGPFNINKNVYNVENQLAYWASENYNVLARNPSFLLNLFFFQD